MTGTIGDERDEFLRATPHRPRTFRKPCSKRRISAHRVVHQLTYQADDVDVGPFVLATNVVHLTHSATLDHRVDGPGVIAHVQPVAHIPTVAIHRQRLAAKNIHDQQRNQLFGKVIGPVVVRAVAGGDGQAKGVRVRPHQMIRRSLGGRVRGVGCVGRGFRETRIVFAERTVHFICRDVMKAVWPRNSLLHLPDLSRGLQQFVSADHVGAHKRIRPVDGPIHM